MRARLWFILVTIEASLWLDVPTTMAAIAATAAVVVGGWFAIRYSRRANVTISAEVHPTPEGLLIAARPSITAVGPLKLKFSKKQEPQIAVTSILGTEAGTKNGEALRARPAFPKDDAGKGQFVGAGETLTSSVLFKVGTAQESLVGWRVDFGVTAGGHLRGGLSWSDRVFVPVPGYPLDSEREPDARREGDTGN